MSKLLSGLDPVPRATLSEQVAKQLAARITAGDWQPGEKLPSEAELCKAFHVGRSSLREALTSLAFIGLIRVRAGGGSYVADQPSAYLNSTWMNGGTLNNKKDLCEFVEARMILESELAALCAERITPEELVELDILIDQMKESVHDSERFARLDHSFHLSVGKAAKNQILSNIVAGVREPIAELIGKSVLLEEGMETAFRGHAKIVETFHQHNPIKAREAMHSHLQSFQRGYSVLFEEYARTNRS